MSRFEAAQELIRAADSVRELINAGLEPRQTDTARVLDANKAYSELSGNPIPR